MNGTICPVIFQKGERPSSGKTKSQKQIAELRAKNKKYLDAVLSGQKPKEPVKPAGVIFKKCKIVVGQAINEIIIKSILPDDRGIERCIRKSIENEMRKKMSDAGFNKRKIKSRIKEEIRSKIKEFRHNDRFGIPVLIDKNYKSAALLAHKKIKAITILERWRTPSKILKTTTYTTSAGAWIGYMGGTFVSIELADGNKLRANIEPRFKDEREKIIGFENARVLSNAKGNVKRLRPYEKKIRTRDQRLKSQSLDAANKKRCIARASDGTPARYTHTDAEILAAVTEYKRLYLRDSFPTMLNCIRTEQTPDAAAATNKKRPYLNYSDPEKLRRRLNKIFAPKTPRQGYQDLK